MPPAIATIVFTVGILGLFYLVRGRGSRMSKGLWLSAIWIFLICSRPPSMWLGMSQNVSGVDATQAYEEGSPFDRAVFLILLVAALVVLVSRSEKVKRLLQRNMPILLYFSFCAISILWSSYSFVAFKRWTKAIGDVGVVLIILTEPDTLSAIKRLLTRLGFILFPLSVLFTKYYPALGRRLTMSWTEETTGVALQKNELGLICMIYGVFFLWMFISEYRVRGNPSRRRHLIAYGAIIAMVIWLLYQCNSMTSITGLVSAATVTWLASRPSRSTAVVHWAVAAVLGLAITAMFFDSGGGMIEALGRNPTLTGRTQIWSMVLSMHTNPWVGTGFESFWLGPRLEYMRTALPNFPINEAHDGYLEVYLNLGWAGICLIALLLVTAYRRIILGIRRNPEKGSLFLGFFLCTLFYSFTEAGFRYMNPSWFFLLLVIVAGSISTIFNERPSKAVREIESTIKRPARATGMTGLAVH